MPTHAELLFQVWTQTHDIRNVARRFCMSETRAQQILDTVTKATSHVAEPQSSVVYKTSENASVTLPYIAWIDGWERRT